MKFKNYSLSLQLYLLLSLLVPRALLEREIDTTQHLTRLDEQQDDNALNIGQLLHGWPLVGVVENGESRLVHFGVLENNGRFPDITISIEAVDPESQVQLYCSPRHHVGARVVPSARTAEWKSTHEGQVFISSRSLFYQDSIAKTILPSNGLTTEVARFSCAVHGVKSAVSKFQLTLRLSFNQRTLESSQESAMRAIYNVCCMKKDTCKGWRTRHTGSANLADEVEFDFCHRTGSICNSQGELRRLDLRDYGLDCKLPVDALLNLTSLESLDLANNKLRGEVGRQVVRLGGLERLSDLNLASNLISGHLSVVGVCSRLTSRLLTLDLDNNRITGRIPPCLFSSTSKVEQLYIARNKLTGYIPDVFSESSTLKALSLADNQLMGTMPVTLGRLKKMEVLYLSNNKLNGALPNSFSELESLEALDISQNQLSELPETWSKNWNPSEKLLVLKLQGNKLKGQLPKQLLKARSLEWLDMSNNELSGTLFSDKGMFPNMKHLNLSRNNLNGTIPEEFASLGLFGQYRSSEFPHQIDLSFNKLSGDIPEFMYVENTPDIVDTEIYLEGNHLACHKWLKLNYIPNFDCAIPVNGRAGNSKDPEFFESEKDIRNQLDALGQTSLLSSSSSSSSPSSSSDGKSTTVLVGVIAAAAAVISFIVLVGVGALIMRYKRRRGRMLGLQYDIANSTSTFSSDEESNNGRANVVNGITRAEIAP
eukprot:g1406.t1